jgi:hypothetical protein
VLVNVLMERMEIILTQLRKCAFLIAQMVGSLMILIGHALKYARQILHFTLIYQQELVLPPVEKI